MNRYAAQGWWRRLASWLGKSPPPLSLDLRGERAAARHLRSLGYRIVAERERSPLGEIDLVAVDGRVVVFVEVKTRQGDVAGDPWEAVDANKQHRLARLAAAYLKRHRLADCPARFDVVSVVWPEGERRPQVEHFKNAFEATGK